MNQEYYDIRSRIGSDPIWFDENAVPRYCPFEPSNSANITAAEVALAEVACQGCGHLFQVAFSRVNVASGRIAEAIRAKTLHYGDPPNIRCCDAGPTMNSVPLRVTEYWHRQDQQYVENGVVKNIERFLRWERDRTLEVDIQPDGVGEQ